MLVKMAGNLFFGTQGPQVKHLNSLRMHRLRPSSSIRLQHILPRPLRLGFPVLARGAGSHPARVVKLPCLSPPHPLSMSRTNLFSPATSLLRHRLTRQDVRICPSLLLLRLPSGLWHQREIGGCSCRPSSKHILISHRELHRQSHTSLLDTIVNCDKNLTLKPRLRLNFSTDSAS